MNHEFFPWNAHWQQVVRNKLVYGVVFAAVVGRAVGVVIPTLFIYLSKYRLFVCDNSVYHLRQINTPFFVEQLVGLNKSSIAIVAMFRIIYRASVFVFASLGMVVFIVVVAIQLHRVCPRCHLEQIGENACVFRLGDKSRQCGS